MNQFQGTFVQWELQNAAWRLLDFCFVGDQPPWSVGGRLEPRLNLGSQIVVIVGFGTWVPGLVEPEFQNLGSRTQVRTTFFGGRVV